MRTSGKKIIGLTGSFGSGKSSVLKMFEELGAFGLEADKIAHEALWMGSEVFEEVQALFKDVQRDEAGSLDRKEIAKAIFSDAYKKQALEEIVHPYVLKRMQEEIKQSHKNLVVLEVPLLFESGFDAICDQTIVVRADEEKVKSRLINKGFSEQEIKSRLKAQMPVDEKVNRADFVIENTQSLIETKQQVEKLFQNLIPVSKGE